MISQWKVHVFRLWKSSWRWIVFLILLVESVHVPLDSRTPAAVFIFIVPYLGFLIAAKLSPERSVRRYVLSALGLICWMGVHGWDPSPDPFHSPFPHPDRMPDIGPLITPLLLMYAFLLYDYFSLVVIGIVLAVFMGRKHEFASFTFHLVYSSLLTSLVITLAAQLLMRVIGQRDRYRQLSITDSLTGLYSLDHTLQTGQAMMREKGKDILLYLIDMNGFKQINDTYGHLIGNEVLVHVAGLLREQLEGFIGVIGRLGGDEFLAVVEAPPGKPLVSFKDKLLRAIVEQPFQLDGNQRIQLSFSVGEARSSADKSLSIHELLHLADMDMYVNKHAMKSLMNNHTEVYGGLSPEQRELLEVLKEKDLPTYIHSQQVAGYAALLAEAVHFPQAELKHLITGAWLHDIGKIMVTAGVLKKTSALTEDEYASMKRHVTYGLDMLGSMRLPQVTTNCIAYHHERWDGQGYPSGIPGTGTPLEGRILQIADAFSAMMMYRPYRESKSLEQALIELKHHAGKQFDPTLVSVFVNAVSRLNKE